MYHYQIHSDFFFFPQVTFLGPNWSLGCRFVISVPKSQIYRGTYFNIFTLFETLDKISVWSDWASTRPCKLIFLMLYPETIELQTQTFSLLTSSEKTIWRYRWRHFKLLLYGESISIFHFSNFPRDCSYSSNILITTFYF